MLKLRQLLCYPQQEDDDSKETNRAIICDYAENATPHGISRIYNTKKISARIFWIVIVLSFLGVLIFEIVYLADKVIQKGISTNIQSTIHNNGLNFPAVSICNANAFSTQKLRLLVEDYYSNVQNWTNEFYEEKFSTFPFQSLSESQIKLLGQQPKTFFAANTCNIGKGNCSYPQDFLMLTNPRDGNCYTFNPNGTVKQLRAGADYGLFLIINIDKESYSIHDQSSQGKHVGVYITLHQPGYHIHLRQRAVLAGPNQLTRIAVLKRKVKRLESPYRDNCSKDTYRNDLCKGKYTVDACLMFCYVYKLKNKCKVVDRRSALSMTQITDEKFEVATDPDDLKCIDKFENDFYNAKVDCDCPVPCEEEYYTTQISTALWPSDVEIDARIKLMKESRNITRIIFKDNFLALQIYYIDFTVDYTVHTPTYDLTSFWSDLGGQLGLWIGASMFSVIEFGSMFIEMLVLKIFPAIKTEHT